MDDFLSGARILVAEDEPIVALEIQGTLTDLGAIVVGPAYTLAQAQILAAAEGLSAAILDVRLGKNEVWPIATALSTRGVPILFHTANINPGRLKSDWPDCEVVVKPAPLKNLTRALIELLRTRS